MAAWSAATSSMAVSLGVTNIIFATNWFKEAHDASSASLTVGAASLTPRNFPMHELTWLGGVAGRDRRFQASNLQVQEARPAAGR